MPTVIPETLAWAAVSCAVWLATLSSVTLPELTFAVGAGLVCGFLCCLARRSLGTSWRIRPHWLRWVLPVSVTLLAETAALARATVAGPRGRLRTVVLPAEPAAAVRGRAAVATLAFCSTPGSIVAHHDLARPGLVVHALVSAGPDLEAVVRR